MTDPTAPPVIVPIPPPALVDATPTIPTDTIIPVSAPAPVTPAPVPADDAVTSVNPVNPVDDTSGIGVADAGGDLGTGGIGDLSGDA